MSAAVRLVTSVELERADEHTISVSARHEVELADGRRVLLLDDRGWTSSGPADVWGYTSVEDIVRTSKDVVGPDEPYEGQSQEDAARAHWTTLANTAQEGGAVVTADELRRLPHDVVLGPQLLARLEA